ncbi:MAG: ATP-dependent dethiobiotin synthetase BioD [Bacteroidales bacterium]|nr:ATP-dependent dethiobiotin synthetase BioD [Bacteroidales bacterium]
MSGTEYFVSGIDTGCGKTYATGRLASVLLKKGARVITSKLIQTGCHGISEDIERHRELMALPLLPQDRQGLTCPYVLKFPASPHLSASIEKIKVDIGLVRKAMEKLKETYEIVLCEGAGGLMVPLTRDYLTIEYIREHQLPLILVSSSKLGSINHTLLSLLACKAHQVHLHALLYNQWPNDDPLIASDSFEVIAAYVKRHHPKAHVWHTNRLDEV